MKNNWEYKKIGDICIVERGGSPRPINQFITDDENGINWIKIGDTTESMYITETAQKIKPEGMKKSRYVQPGDFLLSNSMSFGRPYILKIDGCIHDGWLVLRDKDDLFDKRFLYYYLSSKTTYEKFKSMAVGGVVNNLNSEMVRKVDVPIPSKMEQAKTADVLDKLNSVIVMYQQEIQKLDKLIQARFVEMFGDPIINNMSWPESTIGDGCFVTKLAGFEYSKYIEYDDTGDVVMVKAQNVKNGTLNRKDLSFISNEVSDALPRSQLLPGDVVMTYVGANIGDVALIDDKYKYHLAPNVAKIRVDAKIYNSVYFMYMLMFLNSYIVKNSADTAKAALGMERIRKLKVFIPTYDLQNQFAAFVQQVNKSKFVIHKFLYCTTHNTQSIIKPRPNTKESGKTRGGKPYADEF